MSDVQYGGSIPRYVEYLVNQLVVRFVKVSNGVRSFTRSPARVSSPGTVLYGAEKYGVNRIIER